jgi:hypothetical protein
MQGSGIARVNLAVSFNFFLLFHDALTLRLYSVIDRMINGYGTAAEMRSGMEIKVQGENLTPVPFRPPHIPNDLTSDRTRAAAVKSRRLTSVRCCD